MSPIKAKWTLEEAELKAQELHSLWCTKYERLERIAKVSQSGVLPAPRGYLWWRKCPLCGAHAKRETFPTNRAYRFVHYSCSECDYEYAKVSILD